MLRIPQYYSETLTCKQKMVISILLLTSIVVVADWQAEGAVAVGLYGPDRYDGRYNWALNHPNKYVLCGLVVQCTNS